MRTSIRVLLVLAVGAAILATPPVDATSGDDPELAPYPGRYEVARTKGSVPNEEPVRMDVTGTYDLQMQIDSIAALLQRGPVPDGGLSWDADSRTVVIRLVGPVDGTSPEVEKLKAAVLAKAEGFTVEFRSVKYSRAELERLARRFFSTMHQWAPGLTGAGGGWDCYLNRVVVQVPDNTAEAWRHRIQELNDPRIVMQTYPDDPTAGAGYESRRLR
jgi:hypothetical protein